MEIRMSSLCKFWFYLVNLHLTLSFNLDTSVPIVKEGNKNSYFGFSIAQHVIETERYAPDGSQLPSSLQYVILVGSPRDNVTIPSTPPSVRQTVRPGAIHQCDFSSLVRDCRQLELMVNEPRKNSRGKLEEDRTDQWLGVSVSSSGKPGGKALACAHRHKKVTYKQGTEISAIWGPGICVNMFNTLDQDNFYDVCGDLPTNKGHQDYGVCQAGISCTASKEDKLLIGAAGVYTWRGMVAKNQFLALGSDSNMYLNHHVDYNPPAQDIPPDTEYFSYLGMATAIGRLIRNETTYVSGAPRSNGTGQVLLFSQGARFLEKKLVLDGDQFGSYFGYSVAVMDLNADGLEDLVVGAPFYFSDNIGGAIYVYISGPQGITPATKAVRITSRKMTTAECKLLGCSDARFGFSVASAGDVDQDGYNDLAVGAPFEGDGAVYIFRGSESGVMPEYSQRIAASDLQTARPLTSFGYSLSGGMDMDTNTYPDLAVGAYKSDKVLILRARPVINVTVEMANFPTEIDPNQEERCTSTGRDMRCFTLNVCFAFTAKPVDEFDERITLDYKIVAETFSGRPRSRVFFKGSDDPNNKHIITRSTKLNPQTTPGCKEEPLTVYIQRGNRDLLNPINFQLTYELKPTPPPVMNEGAPIPDMNQFPVINEKTSSLMHSVEFKKNCGMDKVCQSDLQLKASFRLPHEGGNRYILRQGQDKVATLDIEVINDQEDAHEATLNLTLPDNLYYKGTDGGQEFSCLPEGKNVLCTLGNPMREKQRAKFSIRLNPDSLSPTMAELPVQLRVNTTSDEKNEEDNYKMFIIKVVVQTDLILIGSSAPKYAYFSGEIYGESAIRYEEQIGTEIIHTYEVKNIGDGNVASSTVTIYWPYEVENHRPHGKHVLYMMEAPMIDGTGECFVDPVFINPLDIRLDEGRLLKNQLKKTPTTFTLPTNQTNRESEATSYERVKRETEPNAIRSNGKLPSLDCEKGQDGKSSAKCFSFYCNIGQLLSRESAVITIRSRLWNSTFLADYVEYAEIHVRSRGEVKIPEELHVQQLNYDNDVALAETVVIPGIEVKPPEKVPLWIIIVAALAGVILLAVLIVLLYKCGFFRRKTAEDVQKHKAKVEKQKHTHKYKKTYNSYD